MEGVEEKCDKINCKVCEYFLKFVHFCKRENRFINRVELEEREKKWESLIHSSKDITKESRTS